MQCSSPLSMFVDGASWKPPSAYYTGEDGTLQMVPGNTTAEPGNLAPLYKSVCMGPELDFIFTAAPGCVVQFVLHFKDAAEQGQRVFSVVVNDEVITDSFDITEIAGEPNVSLVRAVLGVASETGLVTLTLRQRPDAKEDDLLPIVSAIQAFAADNCPPGPAGAVSVQDTPGTTVVPQIQGELVYRVACSGLDSTDGNKMRIDGTLDGVLFKGENNMVSIDDVNKTAQDFFTSVCMPKVGLDELVLDLPIVKATTYEVVIWLGPTSEGSDFIITVNGKEVAPQEPGIFLPREAPLAMKAFALRSDIDGARLMISSLRGFPLIYGVEVYRATKSLSSGSGGLLDRPDDRLLVWCGAADGLLQLDNGEIVYPSTEIFNDGLLYQPNGPVTASKPEHADLVAKGIFGSFCTVEEATGSVTAYADVENGQQYTLSFMFAETQVKAAAGRIMTVSIDGKLVGQPIDVFAAAGAGNTYQYDLQATAVGYSMEIVVNATVGAPFLNAIMIQGPGVDQSTNDLSLTEGEESLVFSACKPEPGTNMISMIDVSQLPLKNYTAEAPIKGAPQDLAGVFQTHCYMEDGAPITLAFNVPIGADLTIKLYFAEPYMTLPGQRVFSVLIDGVVQVKDLDLLVVAGFAKDYTLEIPYTPFAKIMRIDLIPSVENAIINGVEIYGPKGDSVDQISSQDIPEGPQAGECLVDAVTAPDAVLSADPGALLFGEVTLVDPAFNYRSLTFVNSGGSDITLTGFTCKAGTGMDASKYSFEAAPGATRAFCGTGPVPLSPPVVVPANQRATITAWFEPEARGEASAVVTFAGGDVSVEVVVDGTGYATGDYAHTLHPVIEADTVYFLVGEDQYAPVVLDGSSSHTHDPEHELKGYTWTNVMAGTVLDSGTGSQPVLNCSYGEGTHTVSLTIFDTSDASLAATHTFAVARLDNVPGTLYKLYNLADDPTFGGALPPAPTYVFQDISPFKFDLSMVPTGYTSFVLQMQGSIYYPGGPGEIKMNMAGADAKLFIGIDGQFQSTTTVDLPAGYKYLDVRLYMSTPYAVELALNGFALGASSIDLSKEPPFINKIPYTNVVAGQVSKIDGFLFTGASVLVDGVAVPLETSSSHEATFFWPQHALGPVPVVVVRPDPAGDLVSNTITVTYVESAPKPEGAALGGPFAIQPMFEQKTIPTPHPSRVVFCHGKVYVSDIYGGTITEIVFDDEYNIVTQKIIYTIKGTYSSAILGLACDPRDNDADFKLYFSHSQLYAYGGKAAPTVAAPYVGGISYIMPNGPSPGTATVFIENLSVSGTDHAVNGIAFLNDGRMLIGVGSQTNAGIVGPTGYMPDNGASATVLIADIRAPDFDGAMAMKFLPDTPAAIAAEDPMDQRYGDWTVIGNPSFSNFVTGARNVYGMYVTMTGDVMISNNGPNGNFGGALNGLDPSGKPIAAPDPQTRDAFWIKMPEGCHLGNGNVAMCRAGLDAACKWQSQLTIVGECAPTAIFPTDDGGAGNMFEYNSYAFGGAYYGHVFLSMYKTSSFKFDPSIKEFLSDSDSGGTYPKTTGIHFEPAPGGVHLMADMNNDQLVINYPVDNVMAQHSNPSVYDILPNKGLKVQTGPNTFVIGGDHFDAIVGDVIVNFGGVPATDVRVQGSHWILGSIPSNPAGLCPTEVSITFGTTTLVLPEIFCYLD